jgi:ribosome biogenesis GTPase A
MDTKQRGRFAAAGGTRPHEAVPSYITLNDMAHVMTGYHMMVKDVISRADILLEVIDARFPDETRNNDV